MLLAFVVEQALDRVGGDAFERALKLVNSVGQATRRAVYSNVAGTLAETAAGIKGPKISIPGLGRIPDEIAEGLVREVKFREGRHLDLSAQLQEIADWAAHKGLRFELEVPVGTTFGKGLQELIDQGHVAVIVSDPLLRSQELTAAKEALAQVGLHLGSWKDLRDARPEYAAAVPVLLEYVSRCRESLAICELIWAVACQRPDVEVMRRLVNLARRYTPPSFDLWTQWHNYRKLRNQEDARGQRAAEYAIQSCWYLSYERPKKRGPVRAFDLGFPDEDTLKLIASNDVVSMGLGNALTWTACPELFEDVAELLRDTRLRFGRELLPTALAKCDPSRAPDVLIGLVNDVDIGAHAMVELGRLAHEPARPYIEKFLEHPIDWVRREAKKALRRLDQAAGRRAATAAPFDEVLPASERARGAKLVAGTGAKPRDIEGKVSAFVIGSLAEDERGWTRENCFATSVELDELESLFGKLAQKFNGDFRGSRGRALREEMFQAEHEDWKAYKLNVRIGERAEEIWLHYVLDDPATVDVTIWGPTDFIAKLREVLPEG